MTIIEVSEKNYPQAIKKAANLLTIGGIVIAKADTSYTLLLLPRFIKNHKILNRIKNNRRDKQYSIFIDTKEALLEKVRKEYRQLVAKLIPGKITIVTQPSQPALRYIESLTINQLIRAVKSPLTATSANPSGAEPARNINMIEEYFNDYPVIVLHEGSINKQLPSTVLDVSGDKPNVLRQGSVKIAKTLLKAAVSGNIKA
jgi:L-threonylcarbamoyladenylate synthase